MEYTYRLKIGDVNVVITDKGILTDSKRIIKATQLVKTGGFAKGEWEEHEFVPVIVKYKNV